MCTRWAGTGCRRKAREAPCPLQCPPWSSRDPPGYWYAPPCRDRRWAAGTGSGGGPKGWGGRCTGSSCCTAEQAAVGTSRHRERAQQRMRDEASLREGARRRTAHLLNPRVEGGCPGLPSHHRVHRIRPESGALARRRGRPRLLLRRHGQDGRDNRLELGAQVLGDLRGVRGLPVRGPPQLAPMKRRAGRGGGRRLRAHVPAVPPRGRT